MTDMTASVHPESDDLQRCADDELDAVRDAELVAHVKSCVSCRAEVEQLRRITALLSLTSVPPPDLFARIKARRDAGERVALTVPPVEALGEERPARVARMTVPARATTEHRLRPWRWAAGAVGLAATALLAVRLTIPEDRVAGSLESARSGILRSDSSRSDTFAPAAPSGSDSRSPASAPPSGATATSPLPPALGPRSTDRLRGAGTHLDGRIASDSLATNSARAARADSTSPTSGATRGSFVVVGESPDGLTVRLAFIPRALDLLQVAALDSAARALQRAPERRAVIRYADPSFNRESDSWRLAVRAKDHLESRGVAPARIRLVRVQAVNKTDLPSPADAVEVAIQRP